MRFLKSDFCEMEDKSNACSSRFQFQGKEDVIQEGQEVTDEEEDLSEEDGESKRPVLPIQPKMKKETKSGIIYLSTIPPGMNIRQIRDYFTEFGEVNRSFLQPDKKGWKAKGKPKNQTFTEGWIEFRKRRHAKRAAVTLNNNPVGGKMRKIYHDFLWSVKYLPGFQWVHLNERLAYERISMKQQLRTEISAVKRETDFFSKSIDLSNKLKKKGIIGKGSKNLNQESADPLAAVKGDIGAGEVKPSHSPPPSNITKEQDPPKPNRSSFFESLFGSGD